MTNMYVYENCDNITLSEFMKDGKQPRFCSQYLSNLNLMNIYLYTAVSSLAVNFAHFLIGTWKRVLLRRLFFSFFARHLCL